MEKEIQKIQQIQDTQNYFDLLPNEIIDKIFIYTDPNVKLELVSRRFETIANSNYVIKNKCICLKHYYHFELAGELCKANKHKCVCNSIGYTTSIKYCRADNHFCVCNKNPFAQEVCKSKKHICMCNNGNIIQFVLGCKNLEKHECSCEYYPQYCKNHNN